MPFSPLHLLLFILALSMLLALVQVGLLTVAFEKLGLSAHSAFLLLISSLIGSTINLPLGKITAEQPAEAQRPMLRGLLRHSALPFEGKTLIAINVGGCLIPVSFSYYLTTLHPISFQVIIIATAVVAGVCYFASRPIPGLGIGMPMFVAPLTAALVSISIAPDQSPPLAYICGTLGVLIGADLLRMRDIRRMGAPIASIGGAGTFDGIFITGIVAVLLA